MKTSLLDTLWKRGLPKNSRKTLWPLVIGNSLALTNFVIEDLKKRASKVKDFQKFPTFNLEVIRLSEYLKEFRPDLPPVRDLLLISDAFWKANINNTLTNEINLIHQHHFISFYRG